MNQFQRGTWGGKKQHISIKSVMTIEDDKENHNSNSISKSKYIITFQVLYLDSLTINIKITQ